MPNQQRIDSTFPSATGQRHQAQPPEILAGMGPLEVTACSKRPDPSPIDSVVADLGGAGSAAAPSGTHNSAAPQTPKADLRGMGEVMSTNASSSVKFLHRPEGPRTLDDLIRMARPRTKKQERLLLDLTQLTHDHPEVTPSLAALVYSRLGDNCAASVHECFERLRWDEHWHMPNGLAPLLARVLLYTHPDLNGMLRVVPVPLDEALGMRVSDRKLAGDYARRLEWIDGRPLTEAPSSAQKKPVQFGRPAGGALFEVAE